MRQKLKTLGLCLLAAANAIAAYWALLGWMQNSESTGNVKVFGFCVLVALGSLIWAVETVKEIFKEENTLKSGKNPTVKQKKWMAAMSLNPEEWLVVKNTSDLIVLVNRETKEQRRFPDPEL